MHPATTALILVGYQNDYFAQDGILRCVVEEPDRVDRVLAQTMAFITAAAATPMTLIATPIVLTPEYRAMANSEGILGSIKQAGAFRQGSPGAQTIPELQAWGDRILHVQGKEGFNAFSDTTLDEVLRARRIRDVLVAGMITSLCVDSTGRAAYERGYSVTILSDCTSARTPAEQAFYCSTIFPLYSRPATGAEILAELVSACA